MSRRLQIRNRLDWFTMSLAALIAVLGCLNITSATAGSEAVDWLDFSSKGGKQRTGASGLRSFARVS